MDLVYIIIRGVAIQSCNTILSAYCIETPLIIQE